MSERFAIAASRRLVSPAVEAQQLESPATARARMAAAVAASALVHVVAIVGVLALVGPFAGRKTSPVTLPVSLVYIPGGGGGGGEPGAKSPAPAATPEAASVPAEAPRPTPAPRPKPLAKPKPSAKPPESAAEPAVPGSGAPAETGVGSGAAGGGTGTGSGTGPGAGFTGASPGYGVNPLPPYPVAARQLGLAGVVLLRVSVAADGHPMDVVVLKSSGHAMLDDSAVRTVRTRWRFIPATRNGTPVEDTVQVPIRFRQTDS